MRSWRKGGEKERDPLLRKVGTVPTDKGDRLRGRGKRGEVKASRGTRVTEERVGVRREVHTGKTWVPLLISEVHLGFRLGELVTTRAWSGKKAVSKKGGKGSRGLG